MSKLKISDIKLIRDHDWDELVTSVYGKPYHFQQQEGCQDRGIVTFVVPNKWGNYDDEMHDNIPIELNGEKIGVKFATWLSQDPNTQWFKEDYQNELFWERSFYPDFQTVIDDLYEKGYIPDGHYAINIDW